MKKLEQKYQINKSGTKERKERMKLPARKYPINLSDILYAASRLCNKIAGKIHVTNVYALSACAICRIVSIVIDIAFTFFLLAKYANQLQRLIINNRIGLL